MVWREIEKLSSSPEFQQPSFSFATSTNFDTKQKSCEFTNPIKKFKS